MTFGQHVLIATVRRQPALDSGRRATKRARMPTLEDAEG
jgi:hypothetical protein